MVKPLEHRPQSLGEFDIRTGTNTVFAQSGKNIAALGEIGQQLTDPIAERLITADATADRMAKYEAEKDLPIDLIPEGEGSFSLTKWGKTYDASYNKLDEQIVKSQAKRALQTELLNYTDPARQGPGITRSFEDSASKIIDAYAQSATPTNRAKITRELADDAASYRFQLAKAEQQYNFNQAKSALTESAKVTGEELTQALLTNDLVAADKLAKDLRSTITSSANMGLITQPEAMTMLRDLDKEVKTKAQVGEFLIAQEDGRGPQYIADFVTNPPENFTVAETFDSVKQMVAFQTARNQATQEAESLKVSHATNLIKSGEVTSIDEIDHLNLPLDMQLKLESTLIETRKQAGKKALAQKEVQTRIANGTIAAATSDQINSVYTTAYNDTANNLGRYPTLQEQTLSLLGEGPEGIVPASGLPGTPLGTDVPKFNSIISSALTSGDLASGTSAYQAWDYAVSVKDSPNAIKLEGDALRIATEAKVLANALPPQQAYEAAYRRIMKKDDLEFQTRAEDARKLTAEKDAAYKQIFGVARTDSGSGSSTVFDALFDSNYAAGNSIEASAISTGNQMRGWGPSKYFAEGTVQELPPEKAVPEAQYAYTMDNQIATTMQVIIDENKMIRMREYEEYGHAITPKMEWASSSDEIDLASLSDEDRVLRPLPPVAAMGFDGPIAEVFGALPTRKPRIRIDNGVNIWESDVSLESGPDVARGTRERPTYSLVISNAYGGKDYIPTPKDYNPAETATLTPIPLKEWAPAIYTTDERNLVRSQVEAVLRQPAREAGKRLFQSLLKDEWGNGAANRADFIKMLEVYNIAPPSEGGELYDKVEELLIEQRSK